MARAASPRLEDAAHPGPGPDALGGGLGRRRRRSRARARRWPARHDRPRPRHPGDDAGSRATRRARRRRAQQRRFWLLVMPALGLTLAAVAVGGYLIRRDAATDRSARAVPGPTGGRAGALLLAHRAGDGTVDLAVVVGATRDEAGVLLLPPATQLDVPSFEVRTLAEVASLGGAPLLRTTVANLLGIRLEKVLLLDDTGLQALLRPAAPLRVNLAAPVTFGEDLPAEFGAGPQDLAPTDLFRLLVTPQPGSQLDQLVTVGLVLEAWLDALARPGVARATEAVAPEAEILTEAARAPQRRVDTLPVQSRAVGDDERFEVRAEALEAYRRAALRAHLVAGGARRARVEILNGTGELAVAQAIAARIVPAGGHVTLTGNVPGFGVPRTQVVYYRPAARPDARRLLAALGCGSLQRARRAIGVVDVTIIHGADCPLPDAAPMSDGGRPG